MLAIIFPLSFSLDSVYSEIYGAERLPQKVIITYQPFLTTIVLEKNLGQYYLVLPQGQVRDSWLCLRL